MKSVMKSITILQFYNSKFFIEKLKYLAFIFTVLIFNTNSAKGQSQTLLSPLNDTIRNMSLDYYDAGVIWWKCNTLLPGKLFTELKQYSGLGSNDTMLPYANWRDSMIYWDHIAYQQYYKGIKVEKTAFVEHIRNDTVAYTTGLIVEGLNKSEIPAYGEDDARNAAIEYMDADTFYWQDSIEWYLKRDSFEFDTTYYPTHGELVWALIGDSMLPLNYFLAWKFSIGMTAPVHKAMVLYVDANNLNIIDSISLISHNGPFNHIHYGEKTLDTRWHNTLFTDYHVTWANDGTHNIKTKDSGKGYNIYELPRDHDDDWGDNHWSATSTLWSMTQAWDYFKSVRKIDGPNNAGLECRIHCDIGGDAFFDGLRSTKEFAQFQFGRLDSIFYTGGALDLCGHEYLHAIDHYRKLGRVDEKEEQGAIEEGIGDIMGFLVRRHVVGTPDFTFLKDVGASDWEREMSNPALKNKLVCGAGNPYPKTYKGNNWVFSCTTDAGGVHENMMVIDFWFFLLSNGGINDENSRTADGIGIDDAADIVFHWFFNSFTDGDKFVQAREKSIASAVALFGWCSPEHKATCKAWWAVGVGSQCNDCATDVCRIGDLIGSTSPNLANSKINIDEVKSKIGIYPNPFYNQLTIEIPDVLLNDKTDISYQLIDPNGLVVLDKSEVNKDLKHILDFSELSLGIYTFILRIDDYEVRERIVKIQ
jgi:Zn-dependent metalloprotease